MSTTERKVKIHIPFILRVFLFFWEIHTGRRRWTRAFHLPPPLDSKVKEIKIKKTRANCFSIEFKGQTFILCSPAFENMEVKLREKKDGLFFTFPLLITGPDLFIKTCVRVKIRRSTYREYLSLGKIKRVQ